LSRRFWLIVYLAIWSTVAARISFEFVYLLIPRRGDFADAAHIVPFVAFPAAFGIAFRMLRKARRIAVVLGVYLWLVPVLLYVLLLFAVAAMGGVVAPAAAFFVLVFGAVFGLPALAIGILIHAFGILPLRYFEDRFFASAGPPHEA
jgi:hypothetical protein